MVSQLSSSPGVYWFLDGSGSVLYVGKAKNLKNRLSQYAKKEDERPQIGKLLSQIDKVKNQILESELEALLVEAQLIQRYQPPFNILLKDDKSNLYIAIGPGNFPKVFTARKPEVLRTSEKWTTFGPFQSGYKVRQVLEIARRIFKWCDLPANASHQAMQAGHPSNLKPCFYYHLGLCSGACVGKIKPSEYKEMTGDLKKFLRGKTSELTKEFKQEIAEYSESKAFEKAALVRDQLEALATVTSPKYRLRPDMTLPVLTTKLEEEALISLRAILRQYISLPAGADLKRIEGYDISNISGTNATCSMVTAINGEMDHREYKHFSIKTLNTPNDFAMLKEALTRRQNHPDWGIPEIVLIDGGKGQLRSVISIWKWPSVVVSIAKRPDRLIVPMGVYPKLTYKEIVLTPEIGASRLLQTIRDESHRFSRRLHHIKRDKELLK
ncbi:MAG TPA: GIY-YIG nuclease family protein [Patescibacteria group bacterium]|nr:GIY-YIG nuclease family protein [Patescibacteria group bacterium]